MPHVAVAQEQLGSARKKAAKVTPSAGEGGAYGVVGTSMQCPSSRSNAVPFKIDMSVSQHMPSLAPAPATVLDTALGQSTCHT